MKTNKRTLKDSMAVKELLDFCNKVDPNGEFTAQSIVDDPESYTEMLIRWWIDDGLASSFESRHLAALDIIKGLNALGGKVDVETFDRLVLQHATIMELAKKGEISYELAEALNGVTGYTCVDDPYAAVKSEAACLLDLRKAWRTARSVATNKNALEDAFIEALAYKLKGTFTEACYLEVTQEHLDGMWNLCKTSGPVTKEHVKEAWKYLIQLLCSDGTLLPGVTDYNYHLYESATNAIVDNYEMAISELE